MSVLTDAVFTANSNDGPLQTVAKTISTNNEKTRTLTLTNETASTSNNRAYLSPHLSHVPFPTEAPSMAPFAYQRALQNRRRPKDSVGRDGTLFDRDAKIPTFVHDILMLPGSLHNVLGGEDLFSARDLLRLTTPALLIGYKSCVQPATLQPALLPCPSSHVQGIVIFDLTKADRRAIHSHYRSHSKRRKIQVEIELEVSDGEVKRMDRRAVLAYVYLWSTTRGGEIDEVSEEWTLAGALTGNLGPKQTVLRVEEDGKGDEDEDGWIGKKGEVTDWE